MKINARKYFEINKTVDVTTTNSVVRLATKVQIEMLEAQDTEKEVTELDAMKNGLDLQDDMKKLVQTIMKYTDKQMQQLDDNISVEQYGEGVGYLIMRINGVSDDEIKLSEQKQRKAIEDSKSSK
ncbi:phage tail assembly chaperone [Lactiplantibacillus plantarum]|uniref:phage tail assembly chaperone n=1 Tax=Lactiplantibacillus plantarum TaxID=1590 RepID=UPI001BA8E2DE|nr:phage tail assembly chaperone [Lactiplantibacillus plantarum]MBS0937041.1 phage tail assembly chaperone [Lactiplantibacillus plantarum]MBS0945141.1 phage tail assembly chaperone [Lactiplantibacillus plantarum]